MKKNYTVLPLLFLLISFSCLKAQQSTFSKVLYSENYTIQLNSMAATLDKGFVLIGADLVLKLDSSGNILWNKIVDKVNFGSSSRQLKGGVTVKDSGLVIVGNTDLPICMKLNSKGDFLWAKSIALPGNLFFPEAVIESKDSGLVILGNTDYQTGKIVVAKLDVSGNLKWINVLTGARRSSCASIKQTPDNGYMLSGYMEDSVNYRQALLIKVSSTGAFLWANQYGNEKARLVIVNDGAVSLFNHGNKGAVLKKIDFSGNPIWCKSYKYFGNVNLIKTSDNGFIMVDQEGLIKTDANGNVLWSKTFRGQRNNDIVEANDKGLFVAVTGPFWAFKMQVTFPQVGIIKMNANGETSACVHPSSYSAMNDTVTGFPVSFSASFGGTVAAVSPQLSNVTLQNIIGCIDVLGGVKETAFEKAVSILPNPSNGVFKVSTAEDDSQISIVNTLGQIVYTATIHTIQTIDLTNQPKGIYFYKAIFRDSTYVVGKIVIDN